MVIGGLAAAGLRSRRVRLPGVRLSRLAPYWWRVGRGGGRRSAARSVRAPSSRGPGERPLFPPRSSSDASVTAVTDVKPRRRLPCVLSRYRVGLRLSRLALDWLKMSGRPRRRSRVCSGDVAPPPSSPVPLFPTIGKLIIATGVEELPLYRENALPVWYDMNWFDRPRISSALIGVCIPGGSPQMPFAAACDGESVFVCEPDSVGFKRGLDKIKDRVAVWHGALMEEAYQCSPGYCLTQNYINLNGGSAEHALESLQDKGNHIRLVPQSPTSPCNDDEQISAFEAYRVFCVGNHYFPLESRLARTLSAARHHLSDPTWLPMVEILTSSGHFQV